MQNQAYTLLRLIFIAIESGLIKVLLRLCHRHESEEICKFWISFRL